MKFSDVSQKTGLLQHCEFLTNIGDGGITGDAYLLKLFTNLLNEAMNDVLPLVLGRTDDLRWDDPQQTTFPIGYADIISGKSSYEHIVDTQGNSVYNIAKVFMRYPNNVIGDWDTELNRVTTGGVSTDTGNRSGSFSGLSTDYSKMVNPRFSETGIPDSFMELNGSIFVYPIPNYTHTEGFKILFERAPVRFISSGTTSIGAIPFADVTPGIPDMFHTLLTMRASRNWLAVFKSEAVTLLNTLTDSIMKKEAQLEAFQSKRTPTKSAMSARRFSTR